MENGKWVFNIELSTQIPFTISRLLFPHKEGTFL